MESEALGTIRRAEKVLEGRGGIAGSIQEFLHQAAMDEWATGPHCLTECEECDDDLVAPYVRIALSAAEKILGD